MKSTTIALVLSLATAAVSSADTFPFLEDAEVTALATELSGESAKRNVEGFARHHRMRGSRGYIAAAEQIVAELKRGGLADAHIESLPTDGKIYYGTQRSRPAWNAEFAELWELDANGARVERLASWDAAPITLAQDSESGEATTTLVDVGEGTTEADYAGKDVAGKLVLAAAQPGPVAAIAIEKLGAAGIISYAQNQRTAWWGEDATLVRWGHLDTFAEKKTFAFMISPAKALALQQRLARGQTIRMHAVVRAGQTPGAYQIATATIPGSELPGEEIVYSCHLDHPRPGANDNASGCATILEVARTMAKLIAEKRLAPPRRTIRFVFPPEIEGTLALLNGRPEIAKRIKAAIHLDMVGGGPETKAIFHVTRGPASQPSFIYDVAQSIGEVVNEQTERYAGTGTSKWPLVAKEGGREPLQAAMVPLTLGSDHQVYSDSSFGIPAIYLNDWPDRYIHTSKDVAANIDATKLLRAAFIAGASGYVLSRIGPDDSRALLDVMQDLALRRASTPKRRDPGYANFAKWYERSMVESLSRFGITPPKDDPFLTSHAALFPMVKLPAPTGPRYRRNPAIKGTMGAFGYDYFNDKYGAENARKIRLSEEYRYEALNLVDGQRTTSEIRDILSAIYGPVELANVEEYLAALASIKVISPSP
jgi:aminopeptidase YwaD